MVSEICIGVDVSYKTVFIAIPNKIISALANESLIPFKNLIKKAPETQNL